jgi:hypothetical protein
MALPVSEAGMAWMMKHGDGDDERGRVGGEHRPVPYLPDVDQGIRDPELVGDPRAHHDHGEGHQGHGAS